MNRILRVVLVCIFIVGLTGTYFGCAGSSERDSASKNTSIVVVEDTAIDTHSLDRYKCI